MRVMGHEAVRTRWFGLAGGQKRNIQIAPMYKAEIFGTNLNKCPRQAGWFLAKCRP